MSSSIVSVKNLTVRRGSNIVVDDVSFDLLPESDTALVGPNGAGKSSLVAALFGLIPRLSGDITIISINYPPVVISINCCPQLR